MHEVANPKVWFKTTKCSKYSIRNDVLMSTMRIGYNNNLIILRADQNFDSHQTIFTLNSKIRKYSYLNCIKKIIEC